MSGASLPADEFYRRAVKVFDGSMRAVGSGDWDKPTPCTEWNVRALVGHVMDEDLWVPPLLDGKTIEEVGESLAGDPLGGDPLASWEKAKQDGVAASQGVDLRATVHVSFGDITAEEYLKQVAADHVIHAWDLARAVGASEDLDPETIDATYAYIAPQADAWRAAGAFAPAPSIPDDANRLTQLLALTGRRA